MKAVLTGIDFIETSTGDVKLLEINTNTTIFLTDPIRHSPNRVLMPKTYPNGRQFQKNISLYNPISFACCMECNF